MRASWTPRQRILAYAARMRVFTVSDVFRDLNAATAHGIDAALKKGEIVRHGESVYSLHSIPADDPRVVEALARTREEAVPRASLQRQWAKAEDREATRIEQALPQDSAEKRIERFLSKNPAFLRSTLMDAALGRSDEIIKTLLREDKIHQVEAVFLRAGIEVDDPCVDEMLKQHSEVGAQIVAEIASARKVAGDNPAISYQIEKRNLTDPQGNVLPRPTRVHVRIPGCPPIYGIARGRNRSAGIDWHAGKNTGVSRLTAETIARKVISPMPATLAQLMTEIDKGVAPVSITRHNTGLPVAAIQSQNSLGVPNPKKVPIETRTILTFDSSEHDDVLSALTGINNLHVIRSHLKTGDFHVRNQTGQFTVERKALKDLAASFDDGRLAAQIPRLAGLKHPAFLLIEGDLHNTDMLSPAKLLRIQTRLAGLGIGFLTSRDHAGTAYVIATLIRDLLERDQGIKIAA